MPHHKSAKKRLRQSEQLRLRNKGIRSDMKTAIRKVDTACTEGDRDAADTAARAAVSTIDRAWKRGILKKNSAARKKSSVQRRLAALAPAPAG